MPRGVEVGLWRKGEYKGISNYGNFDMDEMFVVGTCGKLWRLIYVPYWRRRVSLVNRL